MAQQFLTTKITGADELKKVLDKLPAEISAKVSAGALRKGANVIRDEVAARAPHSQAFSQRRSKTKKNRTELIKLRNEIKVKVVSKTSARVNMAVTVGRAFWGMFVEFGRGAVVIRKAKVLSDGSTVYGNQVAATSAKPFMRPGYEAKKAAALDAIGQELGKGVERVARRLAGPLRKTGLLRRR